MPDSTNPVFPPHLHFAHSWRKYQQKILEETDLLFTQHKFHLVAPPGSGKTILGLELMRLVNRKTLILTPTLVIREQWIERLKQDFGVEDDCDWISRDLRQPALLTVCTYQALYQAWKANPQMLGQLQEAQIETLIVDECHHLQKEWWKPLISLKKELTPLLIALTATPPYDVSNFEWARYHELCGDIDEIIYTPELVAAGDLCPHQDYLYLCLPPDAASLEIQDFHRAVVDFTENLQHNYRFINLLKAHPWLNEPEFHTEAIYENPAYFSALLIGLEGLGKVAPLSALGIIGAVLILLATGYPFSFTVVVGMIALVGIEVKNSILLVDFTNQLREEGMGLDEAIQQAGEIRFVPILLTSLTAIGGLIPLAVEENPLYSPLAYVLIGGLISSTLLSRIVTPVLYKLLAPRMKNGVV